MTARSLILVGALAVRCVLLGRRLAQCDRERVARDRLFGMVEPKP